MHNYKMKYLDCLKLANIIVTKMLQDVASSVAEWTQAMQYWYRETYTTHTARDHEMILNTGLHLRLNRPRQTRKAQLTQMEMRNSGACLKAQ